LQNVDFLVPGQGTTKLNWDLPVYKWFLLKARIHWV